MMCRFKLLLLALCACTGADPTLTETGDVPDLDVPAVPTFECDAAVMLRGQTSSDDPCVQNTSLSNGAGTQSLIRADCTDANITAQLDKPHLVMAPEAPTRDVLWVNLPGTAGSPTNMSNLGELAVSEGYRFIGLGYTNATSSNSRCQCADGPRPLDCPELVRQEVVTGEDVTPWFDMEADEAIIPRLTALLTYLAQERPTQGWDAYLNATGEVEWSKIAISGFSQGGGMAALIARDHTVERAVHFSIIAGSVVELVLDDDEARDCTSDETCGEFGYCCPIDDLRCETAPATGGVCLQRAPAPWSLRGPDSDGDNHGDGASSSQATPLNRHFVFLHAQEPAVAYTPQVTEAWGLGDRSTYLNVDSNAGPYPSAQRLFTIGLPPNGPGCSEHQAMGPNACQPRDQTGKPAILPGWRHAMTANLTR